MCNLLVCLYPINVKTAELIGSKYICCGNSHDPSEGFTLSNLKNVVWKKCPHFSIQKMHKFYQKNPRKRVFIEKRFKNGNLNSNS